MCGCDFPVGTICGYRRSIILSLLIDVRRADERGDTLLVRALRSRLSEYGSKRVAMVEQDVNEGGVDFARVGRRASGSVLA
jgi:hypothetical protein